MPAHHLLVELWRLRQAAGSPHVVKVEHRGAALRGAAEQFGRVDFDEALLLQRLTEQLRMEGGEAGAGQRGVESPGADSRRFGSDVALRQAWRAAAGLRRPLAKRCVGRSHVGAA